MALSAFASAAIASNSMRSLPPTQALLIVRVSMDHSVDKTHAVDQDHGPQVLLD